MASDHPIFGRAEEDFDRAALLELQLHRFCEAIQNEFDRLDDFLPPMTDGQSAEDWRSDLWAVTEQVRAAAKTIAAKAAAGSTWRHKQASKATEAA